MAVQSLLSSRVSSGVRTAPLLSTIATWRPLRRAVCQRHLFPLIQIIDCDLASKDLATLRRTAPVLAAHIRLYDSDQRFELRRVGNTFSSGLQHPDMLGKLNISFSELELTGLRATRLGFVRKHYQNTYVNLVCTLRKLETLVNAAYASHGESLFNTRGKWRWYGKKLEGCQSIHSAKGELTSEKNEKTEKAGKFEKWDDRASVDTEITYCEKVEPLWLV